ncbi:hypothetical protein DH2020_028369 [Rehmannia glutinosa]|uniref:Uncharacterized protein n=1 Tax=Rehmannia glutinosa TaxID=99300 RepID=A0ABR0VSG4_REHGL
MDGGDTPGDGTVTCATWIRRPENAHLVVVGKSGPSSLEVFSFDPKATSLSSSHKAKYEFEEGVNPVTMAVHPSGDSLVCSTSTGDCKRDESWYKFYPIPFVLCVSGTGKQMGRLFYLYGWEDNIKFMVEELLPLQGVGLQKCLAFSVDGTRFATGGVHRALSITVVSYRVCWVKSDLSLDSEFLASTSTDGSARVWNTIDGAPVTTLARNSDEKIGLCRFSKDGKKPFLFCSVQRGNTALTGVWDISTWKKIGHRRLLRKPASVMSVSLDGKYLALGSKDGDVCVVGVEKMEVRHWSKRLHLGSNITSLEFCPSERIILSSSSEWGAMVTKLTVPADWKGLVPNAPFFPFSLDFEFRLIFFMHFFFLYFSDWQIYLFLLGLFLASLVVFYVLYQNSDSFWNFPLANDQTPRSNIKTVLRNEQSDPSMWKHLDL